MLYIGERNGEKFPTLNASSQNGTWFVYRRTKSCYVTHVYVPVHLKHENVLKINEPDFSITICNGGKQEVLSYCDVFRQICVELIDGTYRK